MTAESAELQVERKVHIQATSLLATIDWATKSFATILA